MKRGDKDASEPGFDAVLGKLREVVERLESGQLGLEESLTVYEQGVALARRGHGLLDAAEKRVEVLMNDGSTAPLPAQAGDEDR